MSFTILDNDEVFNSNQSIWMQTDINALVAGIGGDGVVSGCAVTAQGSPDMTLAVAVGVITISGVNIAVTAGNVTITTANATNPRIDLVVVSNAGVKSVTAGTAAANPKAPDIPTTSVLLAMVYVPASDTAIQTNQITSKRTVLNTIPAVRGGVLAEGRGRTSGGANNLSIPGFEAAAQSTTGVTNNRLIYESIVVPTTITIDQLVVEVTTLVASGSARLGIYNADINWQPTSLILDAGTVATDTTGIKSISISQVLAPGRYLFAVVTNSSTHQFRTARGGSRLFGYSPALGTTIFTGSVQVAFTFGVLPDPGTAWDTINAANSGNSHMIFCRESTP